MSIHQKIKRKRKQSKSYYASIKNQGMVGGIVNSFETIMSDKHASHIRYIIDVKKNTLVAITNTIFDTEEKLEELSKGNFILRLLPRRLRLQIFKRRYEIIVAPEDHDRQEVLLRISQGFYNPNRKGRSKKGSKKLVKYPVINESA